MQNKSTELEFEMWRIMRAKSEQQYPVSGSMSYLFAMEVISDVKVNVYLLTPFGGPKDLVETLCEDLTFGNSDKICTVMLSRLCDGPRREFHLIRIPCRTSLPNAITRLQRLATTLLGDNSDDDDSDDSGDSGDSGDNGTVSDNDSHEPLRFFENTPVVWDPKTLALIIDAGRKYSISKWLDSPQWAKDYEDGKTTHAPLEQLIDSLKLQEWAKILYEVPC